MLTWKLSCPHCGGPNEIAADRHCLACHHCGAGLWVKLPDNHPTLVAKARIDRREAVFAWDRFLKESDRPLTRSSTRSAQLVYLPFWRVSAIVAARETTTRTRERAHDTTTIALFPAAHYIMPRPTEKVSSTDWRIKPWDLTVSAVADETLGLESLGIRVDTVPLSGWTDVEWTEHSSRWIPQVGFPDAMQRLQQTVMSVMGQNGRGYSEPPKIIAPSITLIYWPVWLLTDSSQPQETSVAEVDGVSGRVVNERSALPSVPSADDAGTDDPPVLCSHRCPDCGYDLNVDQETVVHVCGNCQALIAHDSNGQRHSTAVEFARGEANKDDSWYPFWLFDPDGTLVPAFPIRNFRLLTKFGAVMSGQDRVFGPPPERRPSMVGVSLPRDVAAGLADLIRLHHRPGIRATAKPPANVTEKPDAAPSTGRLIYAPLQMSGPELVDPVTGLCLSRSALATA